MHKDWEAVLFVWFSFSEWPLSSINAVNKYLGCFEVVFGTLCWGHLFHGFLTPFNHNVKTFKISVVPILWFGWMMLQPNYNYITTSCSMFLLGL